MILLLIALSGSLGLAGANYTDHFDEFYAANATAWEMTRALTDAYEATISAEVFWSLFCTMPFFAMWIKQKSVAIPSVIMLIGGGVFMMLVPPDMDMPIKTMFALGITGMLWHLFIKRR
jgi:hypothetical protein